MRSALLALAALFCVTSAVAQPAPQPVNDAAIRAERPPELLSAFRFFTDAGAHTANVRVTPYDLNTPLWSDGALKFRYVYVPEGAQAQYRDEGVFEFPVGTVLIKTFAFAADMRQPTANVHFLETRLLIRHADGWVAYPYIWNDAQTEARLSPIGGTLPVDFTNEAGASQHLDWAVPNRNQCKGCHDHAGEITPIGPTAGNLNRSMHYAQQWFFNARSDATTVDIGEHPQLASWVQNAILDRAPDNAPRFAAAYDPASGTLAARARAYLQVNCAHCHNPDGPAHTSGLDLRSSQTDPTHWGVNKRPVAAGRGSAGMQFAIAPGQPEQSFLLYRMDSTDPGVMMPELGRQLVDERAVALMRQWIAEMDQDGHTQD